MTSLHANSTVLALIALLFFAICLFGSSVTFRLLARARRAQADVKYLWWLFATLAASSTLWSLHYLTVTLTFSAVGQLPTVSYLTSSFLAISLVVLVGFYLPTKEKGSWLIEAGGGIVGFGIAMIHLSSLLQLNAFEFTKAQTTQMLGGFLITTSLGMLATNRIAKPVTRFCKHGGAAAFAIAIFFCYVIGNIHLLKNAVTISIALPYIAGGVGILSVAVAVILSGFAALLIDKSASNAANFTRQLNAITDSVTGLVNRKGFEQKLEAALLTQRDDSSRTVVVSVNINQLKNANAAHGHSAGDYVLASIAARLTAILADNGTVGRYSGNRFILFASQIYNKKDSRQLVESILAAVSEPLYWENSVVVLNATLGYSSYPEHSELASELITFADLAASRPPEDGTGFISKYDPALDEHTRARSALVMDLRQAIHNSQLELYFQPQNDAATRKLTGFEALLRWHHPEQGMISPTVFIPLAEESGQIAMLGEWALEQACLTATTWPEELKIAVNVATQQLMDAAFGDKVEAILRSTGLAAERLELEITESGLINDQDRALMAIKRLKALGVKVAMDDYGTGYSSLATLRTFPFDKIKIDREFIKEVESDLQSAAIVRATIALGNSLNIPVLAEGVETENHLSFLQQEGCNDVQGYLFGKPMPANAVLQLINEHVAMDGNKHKAA